MPKNYPITIIKEKSIKNYPYQTNKQLSKPNPTQMNKKRINKTKINQNKLQNNSKILPLIQVYKFQN